MIKKIFLCLWVSGLVSVQGFALDWDREDLPWDTALKKTCYNFGIAFVKQALSDPLTVTHTAFLRDADPPEAQADTGTIYAGQCTVIIGSGEDNAPPVLQMQHALQIELHFSTSQAKAQAVHNTSHHNVPMLMVIYDGKYYRTSPAPGQKPGDLTYYFAVKDYSFIFDLQDR